MVDLSGIIRDRLDEVLNQARKLVDGGDLKKAASGYAQAARLMQQHAESATSESVKQKRRKDAQRLQATAEQLKQGIVPGKQPVAQTATEEKEQEVEEGGFLDHARGLIAQAKVAWDEIAGLEEIKQFVKEAFALSLAQSPAGVILPAAANLLLYGPPGTGKTLIAAAISKGLEATFFSCKVSDMLSKYFGESSKLIHALFQVAEEKSPSVIFLDDFESIVPSRDSDASGSERRVLTELLTSMDGFDSKSSNKMVLVVAATNKPWLIDQAIVSRFGKLAYVGLPDVTARQQIFELHLSRKGYQVADRLETFARKTEGFSGREIDQICKELIRKMVSRANPGLTGIVDRGKEALANYTLKLQDITLADLEDVTKSVAPTTRQEDLAKYESWGV